MKRIKTISKNIRDIIQSKKKSIIIFIDQNFIPHFISLIQLKKKRKKFFHSIEWNPLFIK